MDQQHREDFYPLSEIRLARFPDDLTTVATIFREYEASLGISLCFQNFAEELANVQGYYLRVWLLEADTECLGCIALREAAPGIAEMKRLYVRATMQGQGWGRHLAETAIEAARGLGYRELILDTIESRMPIAVALYRRLGFTEYGRRTLAGQELLDLRLSLEIG